MTQEIKKFWHFACLGNLNLKIDNKDELNYRKFDVLDFFATDCTCTVNFKIIEYTSKIKKSIYYSFFHM
jgi:hypothetical protein